ncbi:MULTISPECIES: hypothetical protein [Spirosoma]|jgi:hypothetical protein|uniref:Uncharacterized protein n=2 Tax=Spirosoma TaxID=107 RepID=A0A6G9ATB8_9BACT|nr:MULTISPECIES: hypothetical protein [Spirosoma]QHV99106.1 hypothetical protein GJR95_30665 [Spirosoma endbachense]QIP15650.1 hypothetical protein G8759_24970 [Spirosoma aureum]
MSEYSKPIESQTFEQWLDDVIDELTQLGYSDPLSPSDRDWLYTVWDNYDLSSAEAALSFINETPA